MRKRPDQFFPWHIGGEAELLIDGEQFYPAILSAIAQARSYILIEMYLVESGNITASFIKLLMNKASQGITIKLLFDSFGSQNLANADRNTLRQGGIELLFYNPVSFSRLKRNLHRTHRKIIIIDGTVAFTGGAGISDSFTGDLAWRETMIKVQGPVVADWQQLFLDNFISQSSTPRTNQETANTNISNSPNTISSVPVPVPIVAIEQASKSHLQARVVYSKGGTRIALKRSLIRQVRRSQQTVWLATAYFIPSRKIRRALRRAAHVGKDVRLLLPGEMTDHPSVVHASRRYYSQLLRHGVRIYEYQGRFMHTKVALVDEWSSIGSSNMDRWNLLWNLEANQEIKDENFSNEVKNMLLMDFNNSNEILLQDWQQRSTLQRFREWLWGLVDRWLTQWKN